MGDPHNPARYGELWPEDRLRAQLAVLGILKPYIVLSGGWAWHFMVNYWHVDYKHGHDHKDIDAMVPKALVGPAVNCLKNMLGFKKVSTKYDRLPSAEDFRRYEMTLPETEYRRAIRITIDFFVADVPFVEIRDPDSPEPWRVVEPTTLLSYYSEGKHTSEECWAVQAARKLLAAGEEVVGNPALIQPPEGVILEDKNA